MLTVHHLGISQSERIVWLCEELAVPYELVRYDREPSGSAPPEYKALHPFGTAPVIVDGDLVLPESAAIVEYICRTYADDRLILGPGHPDFADYLFWFHFANGSVLPSVMMDVVAQRVAGAAPGGDAARRVGDRTDRAYDLIEKRLGRATFFAGDAFTAADIMMVFALTTMRHVTTRDFTNNPNIRAYLQRIGQRPAYRAAMAKGDPNLPLHLT